MQELSVKDKVEQQSLVDVSLIHHGFTSYMRDYDILIEADWGVGGAGNSKGHYRCRITHCVEANYRTVVADENWIRSWDDLFTNYNAWLNADEPEGFVWGVNWSLAYPGFIYVDNSILALNWSKRLGKVMHEVIIETEAFKLQLVFFDFMLTKIANDVEAIDNTPTR